MTTRGFSVQIDLAKLPPPEKSFYAHAAKPAIRADMAAIVFGQLSPGDIAVLHSEVGIELGRSQLPIIRHTFDAPRFRDLLSPLGEAIAYPNNRAANSVVYPASLVTIAFNDDFAAFDFYELVPVSTGAPKAEPVIRIKGPRVLASIFVKMCDDVAGGAG